MNSVNERAISNGIGVAERVARFGCKSGIACVEGARGIAFGRIPARPR